MNSNGYLTLCVDSQPKGVNMGRRSNYEIMAKIIEFCRQPRSKTRIMDAANLSFKALRTYVSALQAMSFIEVHHSKRKYQATQKGSMFLRKWKEINELMNEP